jgi:predicted nucleic acid-binding protein
VVVETYSVLTRLPPPRRVPPALARDYLRSAFSFPPVVLSPEGYERLIDLAAAEAISGGALYDAVVAATALEAGMTLLTLDQRALSTYRLVGVAHRLV